MHRKRSPLRFLVVPIAVGLLLWWAKLWPFVRGEAPPPGRISSSVTDVARQAYERLGGSFRERVPLEDFAGMFEGMVDPGTGARPQVRRAILTDATGPEHPRALFRVEYPDVDVKADYSFAREDGVWTMQSSVRVRGDNKLPMVLPEPPEPVASKHVSRLPKPTGADAQQGSVKPPQPVVPPALRGRRSYTIKARDTLSGISKHFYGSVRHWRVIREANPGLDPRRMRIGRRIVIPVLPEAVPRPTSAATSSAQP